MVVSSWFHKHSFFNKKPLLPFKRTLETCQMLEGTRKAAADEEKGAVPLSPVPSGSSSSEEGAPLFAFSNGFLAPQRADGHNGNKGSWKEEQRMKERYCLPLEHLDSS